MNDTIKPTQPIKQNKLWTRDFTIITVGSIISMLGNDAAGFAMSLLVLDYTGSSLYYALYLAVYMLPSLFVPILSGPFLDRYSRKKAIYTLDFISAGLYGLLALMLALGAFNFPLFALATFLMGCIDGAYSVAYESFYPLLISEGNFSKAYSVSSTLQEFSIFMMPLSALAYNTIGIELLFVFNAVTFLIAALFERNIHATEPQVASQSGQTLQTTRNVAKQFVLDFKEGISYLAGEAGLLAITLYFVFSSLMSGVTGTLDLPYFKSAFINGEYWYTLVFGLGAVGRIIGGFLHYKWKLPETYKYAIALGVYLTITVLEGTLLYFPIPVMAGMMFVTGILGMTSYNIRISSTQNYVPNEKKGRYNGIFNTLTLAGVMVGQLASGVLAEFLPVRAIIVGTAVLNFAAALIFIGGKHKDVAAIYNKQV